LIDRRFEFIGMPTQVPAKIGKYDIVGVIGRGGMGIVYEATDPHLARRVAIKMITGDFAENPDMLKRFSREAQSVACLQHPNIVTLYDLGANEGNPYLVMEYLDGENLEAALSNRRHLSMLDKMSIIIQVCRGLGYVHRRGVIHRDIKPANIMLCRDGGIKIFDFGIARVGDQNVTRTGEVIGTLKYMAPEQVNSRTADFRADIFSTGVVLYQLITSHLPFEGDNTAATLLKIVHEPPPPLGNFLLNYPPQIEEILLRAMAKKPDDRYGSADDFAFDLEDLLGQLKEELIGREMNAASSWLHQGAVYEAQGTLQRLLKVDPQHSGAMRLLREVQQRIQRVEIGKQVHELRENAEKALAAGQIDEAQEHVDRAIALDREDAGLEQLRQTILAVEARAKKLQSALDTAQAAQSDGDLDTAKRAAEEALVIGPNNSQARTLHRLIAQEMEERTRQREIENLLREARQQISSRNFAAALDILKQAEELDPASPHVHSLAESALAAQENDRRRRELDVLVHEIEEALDRDDFRTASEKAEEAAARFPEDSNLTKLRTLAEQQRQLAERKRFIDEQLTAGRQLLQAGRQGELEERLENAILQIGPEPRLQSLLATVNDNLDRQHSESRTHRLDRAEQEAPTRDLDVNDVPMALPDRPLHGQPDLLEIRSGPFGLALDASVLHSPKPREKQPGEGQRDPEISNGDSRETDIATVVSGQDVRKESSPPRPVQIQPESAGEGLTLERLQVVERQLASLIGPLARVLVKRAAAKTASAFELYEILAADLERDEDRRVFLARRMEFDGGRATPPPSPLRPVPAESVLGLEASGAVPAREQITAAEIEQAAHVLAAHLGPIASILAKKEAKRAVTLRDLHEQLAEHVADLNERERFLKVVGVQGPRSR
jgi:tetratricopeptide (TPR) repeat protein